MLDYKTTRVTREESVEDARRKVVAMSAYCDEQTLAKLYGAAYQDHVLDCRYDLSRRVILYDMYEHRPLTIEEIDAKRQAEQAAKEAERSEVFDQAMERAKQFIDGIRNSKVANKAKEALQDVGANLLKRMLWRKA